MCCFGLFMGIFKFVCFFVCFTHQILNRKAALFCEAFEGLRFQRTLFAHRANIQMSHWVSGIARKKAERSGDRTEDTWAHHFLLVIIGPVGGGGGCPKSRSHSFRSTCPGLNPGGEIVRGCICRAPRAPGSHLEYMERALRAVGTSSFQPHSVSGIARPHGFTVPALSKSVITSL